MVNVADLKPDDEFRFAGKRKWLRVMNIRELSDHDHIPPVGRKILIMAYGCKQYPVLKTTNVNLKEKQ